MYCSYADESSIATADQRKRGGQKINCSSKYEQYVTKISRLMFRFRGSCPEVFCKKVVL